MRRHVPRGQLLVAVALLLAAGPVAAQTLDEAVSGLESTYGRITDLKAEFTQVSHNKSLGQDIRAEGTVYLKKGGKLRWDYKTPSPQQIVSDGTNFWVYTPELNQVNKGEAPKALAGPAGSFLAGLGRVRDEFTVRFLNPAARVDAPDRPVLDLTPKNPDAPASAPRPDHRPQGFTSSARPSLYDQLGQHRHDAVHARHAQCGIPRQPVHLRPAQGRGGGAFEPAVRYPAWPPRTASTSPARWTCRRSPTP